MMTRKHYKEIDQLYNVDHPARQTAIEIIEKAFEPFICDKTFGNKGINGKKYYDLEDKLTLIIADKDYE